MPDKPKTPKPRTRKVVAPKPKKAVAAPAPKPAPVKTAPQPAAVDKPVAKGSAPKPAPKRPPLSDRGRNFSARLREECAALEATIRAVCQHKDRAASAISLLAKSEAVAQNAIALRFAESGE